MAVELTVDNEKIPLNEFVSKILAGIITGAVNSLHEIKKDWKEIKIKVTK